MKKIIIVNNNMKIGGVQKSLYNLLWETEGKYEVTLLLFRATGAYMDQLPPSVRVIECSSLFRYLGISQDECSCYGDKLKRGILATVSRVLGRSAAMKFLLVSQKMLPETYDCAISFLQNGRRKSFYGGTQEFVLRRIRADKKVAFLHCDYENSGADCPENNRLLAEFDTVAACSDGCRDSVIRCCPELAEKCVTVRNFHRIQEIQSLADADTAPYDAEHLHVVMVSRLAHEKGIQRALTAFAKVSRTGVPAMLHLVGDGPERRTLEQCVAELEVQDLVVFHGQQTNPYRFIKNADLFLMTSYHEAAPMVIEEARCLGVPVLTTRTTSSKEMVQDENCGWVCENDQAALEKELLSVLQNPQVLKQTRERLRGYSMDNRIAMEQFISLIEETL